MARNWSPSCATTNCSGPLLSEKLLYYPTVTREPFRNRGRITDLISSEQLFNDIHQAAAEYSKRPHMMCGSRRCWKN
jgi:ferredoxin--NADP+ reductase